VAAQFFASAALAAQFFANAALAAQFFASAALAAQSNLSRQTSLRTPFHLVWFDEIRLPTKVRFCCKAPSIGKLARGKPW